MALSQFSVRAADSGAVAGCLMRVESPLGGAGGGGSVALQRIIPV